jgi:hypothetical protein
MLAFYLIAGAGWRRPSIHGIGAEKLIDRRARQARDEKGFIYGTGRDWIGSDRF